MTAADKKIILEKGSDYRLLIKVKDDAGLLDRNLGGSTDIMSAAYLDDAWGWVMQIFHKNGMRYDCIALVGEVKNIPVGSRVYDPNAAIAYKNISANPIDITAVTDFSDSANWEQISNGVPTVTVVKKSTNGSTVVLDGQTVLDTSSGVIFKNISGSSSTVSAAGTNTNDWEIIKPENGVFFRRFDEAFPGSNLLQGAAVISIDSSDTLLLKVGVSTDPFDTEFNYFYTITLYEDFTGVCEGTLNRNSKREMRILRGKLAVRV